MDKGEKDDPSSPNRNNLFENAAANLLGLSPFALPYASHLAQFPGAFLMGQHPGFPVTSLFGGLGDGGLGHFPASLAASTAAYNSLFSAAYIESHQQKPSPKSTSKSPASFSSSSSSSKTTITKATTTIATTTTSSCSNSISKKTFTSPVVAGTTGVSLLSGKSKKSQGRPPKGDSFPSQNSLKTNGSIMSPSHTSTGYSGMQSPPKSALNLSTKQKKENGVMDADCRSDISSGSSSLSDDSMVTNGDDRSKNMEPTDLSNKQNSGQSIHIDGLKKKLIADQIRQRVQSKPVQNASPSILQPMKRGRGRPPKTGFKDGISVEEIQEYKKQQEELKKQFEANLKEQQMQLKLFKKAQQLKDMETSAKINQLLEAHASLGKPESDNETEHKQLTSSPESSKPKAKSLQASIEKLKAATKQCTSDSKNSSPTHQSQMSSTTHQPRLSSPTHHPRLSSPTQRQKVTSPTHKHNSPTHKPKLGSPTHRHQDEPMSPRMMSPTEKSKLFAENLFNKIRMESEQENSSGNDYSRSRTESEHDHTHDEGETSYSDDGSHDDESESEDRAGESDAYSRKRSADEMSEDTNDGSVSKRPRVQTDERELKIPLERGWKRSTTILAIGKRGFIGEVLYFAPCGKKMKTIPDVMRYIEKHVITNMGRENFSFNTRVNVGEFYEQREEEGTVKLTQEEIVARMALIESKRQKLRKLKEQRGKKKSEKQNKQILLAKQMMEQKFKKKVEQQDMARKAAEYKLQKTLEKQRLKDMAHRIKQMKGAESISLEKKKQQEQLRLLKEQEKLQRQEQMRMERELRAQQILETNLLWYHMEREREMKRHQALMMKEQVNTVIDRYHEMN